MSGPDARMPKGLAMDLALMLLAGVVFIGALAAMKCAGYLPTPAPPCAEVPHV